MNVFLSKLFPHPILTLALWGVWLLLNNTVGAGHIVLGLLLAILIPFLTSGFWPEKNRIQAPFTLLKYLGVVLWDILVANMAVAKLILGRNRDLRPGFFYVDLDIQTPIGISLLANTISLTPGTVSCDLTEDRSRLLVHALHIEDIPAAVKEIKERYEAPLKKIFTAC
ncbi:Na+/H+ antiporter subunit E [Thiolapillus sp.]